MILLHLEEMGVERFTVSARTRYAFKRIIPVLFLRVEYLGLEQPADYPGSTHRCPLCALVLTLVHLPLHYLESLAILRLPHPHTRAALHSHVAKTSRSTAAMTSGSIEPILMV